MTTETTEKLTLAPGRWVTIEGRVTTDPAEADEVGWTDEEAPTVRRRKVEE